MNVLIVDDDRTHHSDIRTRLSGSSLQNIRVYSAYSLREALGQIVSAWQLDFFIVEHTFSDGAEAAAPLIEHIRSRGHSIPGAVMTRTSPALMRNDLVDLFSRGQLYYLEKNAENTRTIDRIVTSTASKPLNILFLDDDPDDVEIVTTGLRSRCGSRFRIDVASSVGDALAKNRHNEYHGYIIDYMLRPGVGPDFYLKIPEAHRQRPAVLMTGSTQLSQMDSNLRSLGKDHLHFVSKRDLDFAQLAEFLLYDRMLRNRSASA